MDKINIFINIKDGNMGLTKLFSKKSRERKRYKKLFRKLNPNNEVMPTKNIPVDLIQVGKYSYGAINVQYWGAENEGLKIGNFVSIANNVEFILSGNHYLETFSTYPFKAKFFNGGVEAFGKGKIVISDDVWIGNGCTILSGVNIGQGAVMAAGTVVTKDIPPYAVVGGNPAKIIKYRFNEAIRKKMIEINFENIEIEEMKKIQELLYKKLDMKIFEIIKKTINKR